MYHQHPLNSIRYLILASLVVLLVTLTPNTGSKGDRLYKTKRVPFHHLSRLVDGLVHENKSLSKMQATIIDVIGNIVLFMPFGVVASLALRRKKYSAWLIVGLTFSAGLFFSTFIETAQFWLPTRLTDIDDIIFNSSGALLGAALLSAFYSDDKLKLVLHN